MRVYESPTVLLNEDLAEGVYAASGASASSDCWSVDAYFHQTPVNGDRRYVIQINAKHNWGIAAIDAHTSNCIITISFNQLVEYNGVPTHSISIAKNINTTNPNESLGFADTIVYSDEGLQISNVEIQCTGI